MKAHPKREEIISLIESIIPAYEPEPGPGMREAEWTARMEVYDDYQEIKYELNRLLMGLDT